MHAASELEAAWSATCALCGAECTAYVTHMWGGMLHCTDSEPKAQAAKTLTSELKFKPEYVCRVLISKSIQATVCLGERTIVEGVSPEGNHRLALISLAF